MGNITVKRAIAKQEEAPIPLRRGRHRKNEPSGRESLLRAGKTAFAEHGFERSNLRDIAKNAGVDSGLVRVLFGSKDGLWNACMKEILDEAIPLLKEVRVLSLKDASASDRLHSIILILAKFYWNHQEVRQFVVQHSSEGGTRMQELMERLVRPLYASLGPVIEEAAREGSIRAVHPALFFSLLMTTLNWPKAVPALVHDLDAAIAPKDVPDLLVKNALLALLKTENEKAE